MSSEKIYQPTANLPVSLSATALAHLKKQIAALGHGVGLRLGIKQSGCSGYAYTVEIIDAPNSDDHVFTGADGISVVVAHKDYPFVRGTEIDFVKEGVNAHFVYRNPNETGGCGCGESFTVG